MDSVVNPLLVEYGKTFLYYGNTGDHGLYAASALSKNCIVTARHSLPALNYGDTVNLRNESSGKVLSAKVACFDEEIGVLFLKTSEDIEAPDLDMPAQGMSYCLFGFSDHVATQSKMSVSIGVISSTRSEKGLIRGTSGLEIGDCGGPCFAVNGRAFIGICVGSSCGITISDNTRPVDSTIHQPPSAYIVPANILEFSARSNGLIAQLQQ